MRPRKRSATGFFSSGYCTVTGFLKKCDRVTPIPCRMGTSGTLFFMREPPGGWRVPTACPFSSCEDPRLDEDGDDEEVRQRQGEHDLPRNAHVLVDADAGQRGPDPEH